MEFTRTANAGGLLKLDGVTILLDGVCREVKPYPATPPEQRAALMESWPDAVCFTHTHKDHYDPVYAAAYERETEKTILAPGKEQCRSVGGVTVTAIPSRHIGAAGKTVEHTSFLICGSRCVWFTGDASPLQWRGRQDLPKPDVLIVPYAYTANPTGWSLTQSIGAEKIVLLHMPDHQQDTLGLWSAVKTTVGQDSDLQIPEMGQRIVLF